MSTSKVPKEVQNPLVRPSFAFDSMEDALSAFAQGEFLVVMDDENRENEGDLIIAASLCTTEKMAWMIKHTRYVHSRNIC
jgi:3,4-dihydroxy-2-butanone 4-phosphate synthase